MQRERWIVANLLRDFHQVDVLRERDPIVEILELTQVYARAL